LLSVLAGTATIAVLGLAALRWTGFTAALWAMALLAFNEYHIYVSTLAIDKPFQLLFCALAAASFMRFLRDEKPGALYVAGAMTGLGFLCKETTVLLLPAFFACLLLSRRHRPWLKRPAPYVAALIFGAVISPDVAVNFFFDDTLEYTYTDHLSRAAGIGFTRHHLLFFFRDAIAWVYALRGEELYDLAPEYASMNSALGLILFGVATVWLARLASSADARNDAVRLYLPLAFWAVLGFFLVIDVSAEGPIRELVYVAWFWVDLTLIPATLMAGAFLASLGSWRRTLGVAFAGLAVVYSAGAAALDRVGTPRGPVVAFNPEYVWPPDGRSVEVRAVFDYCMLCAKDMSVTLLDVKLREPDGSVRSALGTDLVRLAADSPDGTRLALKARDADPAENPDERWQERMWYDISYALTDRSGNRYVVEDRVIFPLQAYQYGPRFWTGEPRGAAYRPQ
jgi:hypothetical protein